MSKNKMKTLLETKDYVEVEIDLPFHSSVHEEGSSIYVRIDEKEFKKITIHLQGEIEIFKCKYHGNIARVWYNNRCTCEDWENAIKLANEYLSTF